MPQLVTVAGAILEEEEEEVYTRPKRDIHRALEAITEHKDQNEDDMDCDEETTLVALLRDEYVFLRRIYAVTLPLSCISPG